MRTKVIQKSLFVGSDLSQTIMTHLTTLQLSLPTLLYNRQRTSHPQCNMGMSYKCYTLPNASHDTVIMVMQDTRKLSRRTPMSTSGLPWPSLATPPSCCRQRGGLKMRQRRCQTVIRRPNQCSTAAPGPLASFALPRCFESKRKRSVARGLGTRSRLKWRSGPW